MDQAKTPEVKIFLNREAVRTCLDENFGGQLDQLTESEEEILVTRILEELEILIQRLNEDQGEESMRVIKSGQLETYIQEVIGTVIKEILYQKRRRAHHETGDWEYEKPMIKITKIAVTVVVLVGITLAVVYGPSALDNALERDERFQVLGLLRHQAAINQVEFHESDYEDMNVQELWEIYGNGNRILDQREQPRFEEPEEQEVPAYLEYTVKEGNGLFHIMQASGITNFNEQLQYADQYIQLLLQLNPELAEGLFQWNQRTNLWNIQRSGDTIIIPTATTWKKFIGEDISNVELPR